MGTATRFEDLVIWQRARELTKAVYATTAVGQFAKDWGLSSQTQRSAVSVMSNIAQGFDRFNRAEFQQFLSIAKGSCSELRSHLYIARDLGYVDEDDFRRLLLQTEDLSNQIGAMRAYIEQDKKRMAAAKKPTQNSELRTQNPGRAK